MVGRSRWRRLRAALPVRRGILIIDETSFPKEGRDSVGVEKRVRYAGQHGVVRPARIATALGRALDDRLLERAIYNSPVHRFHLSLAHTSADLERTVEEIERALV